MRHVSILIRMRQCVGSTFPMYATTIHTTGRLDPTYGLRRTNAWPQGYPSAATDPAVCRRAVDYRVEHFRVSAFHGTLIRILVSLLKQSPSQARIQIGTEVVCVCLCGL